MKKKLYYTVFPKLKRSQIVTISVIASLLFLLGWTLLSLTEVLPAVVLPSPGSVFSKFVTIFTEGFSGHSIWQHLGISLFRVCAALLLAVLCAVPLGILVAVNDFLAAIVDPFIEFYRPLPPLAYLPLVIIWFGVGESSKLILIFLAIFAPIFLNTRAGVASIPKERINAAMSLGANKLQLLVYIIFPSALHSILTGIRIGIGFGWTTLVAAEMVAATSGLGHMVLSASEFLQTEVVFIGILLIGILALGTDVLMKTCIRRLIHWQGH